MSCKRIELGGGAAVWTCHRAAAHPPCSACGGPGGRLACLFELSGAKAGQPCDKALCRRCAGATEPVMCPPHQRLVDARAPRGGGTLLALLVLLLSGCTAGQLRAVNYAGAAIATATIAIDWCQTRSAALEGWRGREEGGMPASHVIGSQPGSGAVDLYFFGATVAVLGVAQLLPARARPALYGLVAGAEFTTARGNLATTSGGCWR